MIPKIIFKVSWVHNLMFDKNRYLPKEERTKPKYGFSEGLILKQKIKNFIEKATKIEGEILTCIQKQTGFEWQQAEIIVYLSDTVPNSYAMPLTLKYHENGNYMLIVFIHELVHNNLPEELQDSWPDELREKYVDFITKEVCEELKLPCDSYKGFKIQDFSSINKPKNQNLREYLLSNSKVITNT